MSANLRRMGAVIAGAYPAPAPGPLTYGLQAYYNLDENSGARLDSSGNGYHLTDNNTVLSDVGQGGVGTAAKFVAANSEYLSLAYPLPAEFYPGGADFSGDWEAIVWAFLPAGSASGTMRAWNFGAASAFDRCASCFINGTNVEFSVYHAGGTANPRIPGAAALDVWHAISLRYDSTSSMLTSQLDGDTGGEQTAAITAPFKHSGSVPFEIGRTANAYGDGRAQSFAFYNRVLTTAERAYLTGAARSHSDAYAWRP